MRRTVTLLIVAVLHAATLYVLLSAAGDRDLTPGAAAPMQVMLLPAPLLPRVRIDAFPAAHLSIAKSYTAELPGPGWLAPEAPSAGGQPGVDWNAEAHRAVRAFEIRREQSLHSSNPGATQADDWSLFHGHHAGDRFKTEDGDWIVWINSDCYQVASWHTGAPTTVSSAVPQTVCAGDGHVR